MKRKVTAILSLILSVSFFSCKTTNEEVTSEVIPIQTVSPEISPTPEEKTGPSNSQLSSITDYISNAQDHIVAAASEQLGGWTTSSSVMEYYFDDSKWTDASSSYRSRAS